jgi:hypothetical protein
MKLKYTKPRNTKQVYTGKIRVLKEDVARISLFEGSRDELKESVGEIPRDYFPEGIELKVGDVFRYTTNISIKMVISGQPTQREIERMRREIERRLPKGEY